MNCGYANRIGRRGGSAPWPPSPPPTEDAGGRGGAGPQFQQPTKAEFDTAVEPLRAKVKGKIVLMGKAAVVPVNFNPPPLRRGEGDGRGGRGGRGPGRGTPNPDRMTAAQMNEARSALSKIEPTIEYCLKVEISVAWLSLRNVAASEAYRQAPSIRECQVLLNRHQTFRIARYHMRSPSRTHCG